MRKMKAYETPSVITVDSEHLASALGPSISCTGFGGSVAGG